MDDDDDGDDGDEMHGFVYQLIYFMIRIKTCCCLFWKCICTLMGLDWLRYEMPSCSPVPGVFKNFASVGINPVPQESVLLFLGIIGRVIFFIHFFILVLYILAVWLSLPLWIHCFNEHIHLSRFFFRICFKNFKITWRTKMETIDPAREGERAPRCSTNSGVGLKNCLARLAISSLIRQVNNQLFLTEISYIIK